MLLDYLACADQFLALPGPWFTFCRFAYCPSVFCNLSRLLRVFLFLTYKVLAIWVLFASTSLDTFKTGPGQEHSSRQVRSFEASAKASAHVL